MKRGKAVVELYAVVGGLTFLLGVAIYSALIIAKKTDETIVKYDSGESSRPPLVVKFPDEVFKPKTSAQK